MPKNTKPRSAELQGFVFGSVCDKPTNTVAYLDQQQNFDVIAHLARRSGVAASSIAAQMAAWGLEVRT